jgi:ribose 1,5-bisphosphokinase
MTEAEFDAALSRNMFLMHWAAYCLRYGIPQSVLGDVAAGRIVVLNGPRGALAAARAAFCGPKGGADRRARSAARRPA